MIGAGRHGPLWSGLLGATADRVVETAPCSVLAVRPPTYEFAVEPEDETAEASRANREIIMNAQRLRVEADLRIADRYTLGPSVRVLEVPAHPDDGGFHHIGRKTHDTPVHIYTAARRSQILQRFQMIHPHPGAFQYLQRIPVNRPHLFAAEIPDRLHG